MRKGIGQGLAQGIVDGFPSSMQATRCSHWFPSVLNRQNGGKGLDLFAPHVNNQREVVCIPVALDFETRHVNPAAQKRGRETVSYTHLTLPTKA